jgi:hypothetical protein
VSVETVFSNILSLYTKWYDRSSFMYKSISYIRGAQIPVPGGRETKYCNVEPNVCGSSLWNLFHVTLLAPRILRLILDFWKICATLHIAVVKLHLQEKQYYDTGALLKVLSLIKYFHAHIMTYSVYTLSIHYLCRMKLS